MSEINPKYKKVIDEWFALGCKDGDGATAWIKFYKTDNRDSARIGWHRLLTNVNAQEYIKQKHEEVQKRLQLEHHIGVGDIVKKLKKMGIDGQVEWQGVDIAVKPPEQLKAIDMLNKMIGGYKEEDKAVNIEVNVYKDSYTSARDHIEAIEDEETDTD